MNTLRYIITISLLFLIVCADIAVAQSKKLGKKDKLSKEIKVKWRKIDDGMYFASIDSPKKSRVSDNKISVLKVDPSVYRVELHCSTEYDTIFRTAEEWCSYKSLTAAVNAGMFRLNDYKTGMGFVKNFSHTNNGDFRGVYKALAAFNRKSNSVQEFNIYDLENESWSELQNNYYSFLQSIRMIDSKRKLSSWKRKRRLSCSMVTLAVDGSGNPLVLFTRSPHTLDEFSNIMLMLPLDIQRAMYLEGGPQTSLFVSGKDTTIAKVGSYVYPGYAHDRNIEFWKLPNVIGFKKRK